VLDALAVRPDRKVFVDNSPTNNDGGTALGMPTVLCTTEQETVVALKELLRADLGD
jgi:FMN phosphatase YigB (HAD superfamily)